MTADVLPSSRGVDAWVTHGGPDAAGVPAFDFSTNSNACGPCPEALQAVQAADATRYPDPAYTALREGLAAFHGVDADRIVLAASASEFIHRITAVAAQQGATRVTVPPHSYGDYAHAAQARGLTLVRCAGSASSSGSGSVCVSADASVQANGSGAAGLHWACEPSSPLGRADEVAQAWRADTLAGPKPALRVLDCAYAPLRLEGDNAWAGGPRGLPEHCWQLWTPNKALGLTGVRAAYVVAPAGASASARMLAALAPSWPVGAHGVALLQAWHQPSVQRWLVHSLRTLSDWKQRQHTLCLDLGWAVHAGSLANYFCALPDSPDLAQDLAALRGAGIKLRDAASFGLPGTVRMGVLPPPAQDALRAAWQVLRRSE